MEIAWKDFGVNQDVIIFPTLECWIELDDTCKDSIEVTYRLAYEPQRQYVREVVFVDRAVPKPDIGYFGYGVIWGVLVAMFVSKFRKLLSKRQSKE